jgi:hypothetical protein
VDLIAPLAASVALEARRTHLVDYCLPAALILRHFESNNAVLASPHLSKRLSSSQTILVPDERFQGFTTE